MTAATLSAPAPVATRTSRPPRVRKRRTSTPTTLEAFLHWKPEDGYKYEWNNGVIEKSIKMITPKQFYLVDNLVSLLERAKPTAGGRLICEAQNMTSPTQVRIPDIAYYTQAQIRKAADGSNDPVTELAFEIISDNDKINKVYRKLEEYFAAGVRVVWLIFPEFKKVHVYTAPEEVAICKGKTLCSAEKVIPGFAISAEDLFAQQ